MGQRLLRAKRKIANAGIPYRVPTAEASAGTPRRRPRRDLPRVHDGVRTDDRRRPGGRGDPARAAARRADARLRRGPRAARPDAAPARPPGRPRRRRRARHARGPGPLAVGHRRDQRGALPRSTSPARERGPYRIQADLAAVHATALDAGSTDWLRIVALYDELLAIHPSPVVALNRAVAVGMSDGPLAGLRALDAVAAELPDLHLVPAARAELLARAGRPSDSAGRPRPGDRARPIRRGATPARPPARRARANVGLSGQLLA